MTSTRGWLAARLVPAALAALSARAAGAESAKDRGPEGEAVVHVEIDAAAADATASWARVAARLARCARVDGTVWFAFGSLRVRAQPAARGGCRIDVDLEREGDRRAFVCTVPAGTAFHLNPLGAPGDRKQSPPNELPRELAPLCAPPSRPPESGATR